MEAMVLFRVALGYSHKDIWRKNLSASSKTQGRRKSKGAGLSGGKRVS